MASSVVLLAFSYLKHFLILMLRPNPNLLLLHLNEKQGRGGKGGGGVGTPQGHTLRQTDADIPRRMSRPELETL